MKLQDILEPGREPQPVGEERRGPPFFRRNTLGKPRVVWPTLVATPKSHAFGLDMPGCVWEDGRPTVPLAVEREQALGYDRDTTAVQMGQ